jgi:hypothetical protein
MSATLGKPFFAEKGKATVQTMNIEKLISYSY